MSIMESDIWEVRVRRFFWIVGAALGAIACYTTRHYINGDALVYIEMGEALRTGNLWGLANLTYSPGYPILSGIWQFLPGMNPMSEAQLHKVLNFICFLLAMAAADRLIRILGDENRRLRAGDYIPLPIVLMSSLCCVAFLSSTLKWVKIQVISPDMLLYAIIVTCATILLLIRRNPSSYSLYALLGLMIGLGYLVKSFFFMFSAALFIVAGLCAGPIRKAVPRLLVGIAVMLLVAAPLIGALSYRMGKLSFGELGKWSYARLVSGEGSPVHKPELLNEKPRVLMYHSPIPCTQPETFDICRWMVGIEPKFDLEAQLVRFAKNVKEIYDGHWLFFIIAGWLLIRQFWGSYDFFAFRPPSDTMVLLLPAVMGTALYCLVFMESRYIAAFFFMGGVSVICALRYRPGSRGYPIGAWGAAVVTLIFFVATFGAVIDQSKRSLISTDGKQSHREAFLEQTAVGKYLRESGVPKGAEVAVAAPNPPLYWARMLGVRITGSVKDRSEFLSSTSGRARAVDTLRDAGIRAIVTKGNDFEKLVNEGWARVPGTVDYYALLLDKTPAAKSRSDT